MRFPFSSLFPGHVVSEVMGFVDDDQIVVAPINGLKIDVAGEATVSTQVRMAEHVVAKPVIKEGVKLVIEPVDGPVFSELLRAKDKDTFVSQLKILDDRKGRVRFAQTHAVGKDAAVMGKDFIDGAFHAVFLELEERLPDLGLKEGCPADVSIGSSRITQIFVEDMKKGLVVDELRAVVLIELFQVLEDFVFDIFNKVCIIPKVVKPCLQVSPVPVAVHHEVKLDVAIAWRRAQVRG